MDFIKSINLKSDFDLINQNHRINECDADAKIKGKLNNYSDKIVFASLVLNSNNVINLTTHDLVAC